MTQEDIEQVIKDQPEIWVEKPEKEKEKGKGKKEEEGKGKEKEEIDKRKASISEKHQSTTDMGSSPRKKRKISKPTYQAVLHDDDLETIADRVDNTISTRITAISTLQEALKQTIETQITELKMLVTTYHTWLPHL